jgi:hypothetical protein
MFCAWKPFQHHQRGVAFGGSVGLEHTSVFTISPWRFSTNRFPL